MKTKIVISAGAPERLAREGSAVRVVAEIDIANRGRDTVRVLAAKSEALLFADGAYLGGGGGAARIPPIEPGQSATLTCGFVGGAHDRGKSPRRSRIRPALELAAADVVEMRLVVGVKLRLAGEAEEREEWFAGVIRAAPDAVTNITLSPTDRPAGGLYQLELDDLSAPGAA